MARAAFSTLQPAGPCRLASASFESILIADNASVNQRCHSRFLLLHKLVDAPVAEVRRIDGSRAVHRYIMWGIDLAGDLAERSQHAQNLTVQIHLDDARIIA